MERKVLVGMLLLGALIVFALATFYIKNWQFVVSKGYKLHANFEKALDLSAGDEVRVSGVEVGRIDSVSVDTSTESTKPVEAVLWLRHGVNVHEEDIAHIQIRSIFGGSYISIERMNPEARLLIDGDTIPNTKVSSGITEVVAKADAVFTDASSAVADAAKTMENFRNITDRLESGEGTLGKLLADQEAYDRICNTLDATKQAFENIQTFTQEVREGEGVLAKLINNKQMADDLQALFSNASASVADLKQMTTEMREGKGLMGKLLSDEAFAAQAQSIFDNAAVVSEDLKKITTDVREGKSAMGKLLTDPEMAGKLDGIVASLEAFTAEMKDVSEKFEGSTLGQLATNDVVYQKLDNTLTKLNDLVNSVTEGKGFVGKVLTDERLYTQLTTAMDSVQQLLDEYREQSPILTFAGAIFGAF